MSLLGIITARGGSKRIPRKNIRNFMGQPMLAYAIKACQDSNIFDEIMVSTDDAEIAQMALEYKAKIPFMRNEATSNDMAPTYDVLEEVLQEYKKIGKEFDSTCCVYPCVPFLSAEILKNAYENFSTSGYDSLIPIVRFSFPIQRAFKINKNNKLEYRELESANCRSQDLEPLFYDAAMFYFGNTEKLLNNKSFLGENSSYIELNEQHVQDIDNESDWKMAELKYRALHGL